MKTITCLTVSMIWVLLSLSQALTQEIKLDDKVVARLADVLSGRKFDNSWIQTRGRGDIFAQYLNSVPLVISASGSGSSAVVRRNSESTALIVTNEHVVSSRFVDSAGRPSVLLVFYDPELANQPFNRGQLANCAREQKPTSWCRSLRQSVRTAHILEVDPARDLALLSVQNVPKAAVEIPTGQIEQVKPGDDVFVLGHPFELLWSLTTGIVSAVRKQFPTGEPPNTVRTTVIQTQAPVNPGNSGGPMLTPDGRLVGVVFAQRLSQVVAGTTRGSGVPADDIKIPAPGINFAIGVNEVQSLVTEFSRRPRQ